VSREVLLGIDLGTTVLKVAAFDARSGAVLARVSERLEVRTAEGGLREQDPADVDRAVRKVLSRVRGDLGARWQKVTGIGLSSQAGSTIIADRETGRAHTRMILWNDSRAFQYLPAIAAKKTVRYWRSFSLQDQPGAGLGRLVWLKKHHPRLIRESNIYIGAGEYLYYRLTGVWRQDAGNALQIGCYSVPKRKLIPGPLELVGVPVTFFAPMREGHETNPLSEDAAALFGLSGEIPVAGPYFDHEAGYLSAASAYRAPLQFSLGTAWVGNFVLPEDVTGSSPFQLVVPSPIGEGRLVVQPLLTGNVAWDWGLQNLLSRDHKKALGKVGGVFEEEFLPPFGLVVLPWVARPNPVEPSAFGAATFFGMGADTSSRDLLRALAVGLVCELSRVFEEVRDSGHVGSVVLAGGASKGVFFRDLIATLFSPLSVYCMEDEDLAGSRGALSGFSKRVARGRTQKIRRPEKKLRDQIQKRYELYLEVFERLYGGVPEGGVFRFG
jgi:xylulokinase